jgi:hypothetical protein
VFAPQGKILCVGIGNTIVSMSDYIGQPLHAVINHNGIVVVSAAVSWYGRPPTDNGNGNNDGRKHDIFVLSVILPFLAPFFVSSLSQ